MPTINDGIMTRLSFANDGGLLQTGENDGRMSRQIFANDGNSLTDLTAVSETFFLLINDNDAMLINATDEMLIQ